MIEVISLISLVSIAASTGLIIICARIINKNICKKFEEIKAEQEKIQEEAWSIQDAGESIRKDVTFSRDFINNCAKNERKLKDKIKKLENEIKTIKNRIYSLKKDLRMAKTQINIRIKNEKPKTPTEEKTP